MTRLGQNEARAGTVPSQRRTAGLEGAGPGPAGGQDAAAATPTGGSGPRQKAAPPGGQQPTLYERVEALLVRFRPGAPQTARGIAQEIGHANLRSLRPVLDRMAVQGVLVKTELHPRRATWLVERMNIPIPLPVLLAAAGLDSLHALSRLLPYLKGTGAEQAYTILREMP
ncbi:hypothetical protein [Streptomyces sp. NPDC058092]|uniref:hypothetical protein n=1 Tax=Streptomyces sp. NPDC058092 TaxID=3346336 RepID=UPI0036E52B80